MRKIVFVFVITFITSILVISQVQFKGNVQVRGSGGAGKHGGGFSIPSSFTWEQVPSTPDFVISIAEVGTKLFAGTRSGLPTTYLGGVYKLESGSWSKVNAGLSARVSICSDWPSPCSSAPTGGTFTLTYSGQTTNAIAFNASNSTIQTELTSLSTIGSGNLVISDGPLGQSVTITFQGTRANDDPTNITMNSSGLTGTTPGGMIRGPRFIAQLYTTPTNTLLAIVRNNLLTEVFRLPSGSTTWQKATGIGGAALIFDYTADASGNLLLVDTVITNNVWRSTDDGVSWSAFSTISETCYKPTADPRPIAIYKAATSIAPDNTIFAAAHDDILHYSTDNGATWNCMNIPDGLPIGGGSFIRTNGSGQPMFGGEFGGFFLHTGALASSTWTYQDSGYFTGNAETVHDLIKLSNNDLIIHAKRPYRSTDGGVTWTLDDNGIPAGAIDNFDTVGGTFSVCSHTITIGTDKKLYMAVVNQLSGWGIYRTTAAVVP